MSYHPLFVSPHGWTFACPVGAMPPLGWELARKAPTKVFTDNGWVSVASFAAPAPVPVKAPWELAPTTSKKKFKSGYKINFDW